MTGKEIIKALECMKGISENDISTITVKNAIALINRQQAEIERLKEELEIRNQKRASIFEISNAYERGRTKAIKEFAEKVKAKCDYMNDYYGLDYGWAIDRIYEEVDELVKEMVGEDK